MAEFTIPTTWMDTNKVSESAENGILTKTYIYMVAMSLTVTLPTTGDFVVGLGEALRSTKERQEDEHLYKVTLVISTGQSTPGVPTVGAVDIEEDIDWTPIEADMTAIEWFQAEKDYVPTPAATSDANSAKTELKASLGGMPSTALDLAANYINGSRVVRRLIRRVFPSPTQIPVTTGLFKLMQAVDKGQRVWEIYRPVVTKTTTYKVRPTLPTNPPINKVQTPAVEIALPEGYQFKKTIHRLRRTSRDNLHVLMEEWQGIPGSYNSDYYPPAT